MNFYEFQYPYYALIMAENDNAAIVKYIDSVAGDEEDYKELLSECQEVKSDYAIAAFARTQGENGELIELDEILEQLRSEQTQLLVVDGAFR